MGKWRRRQQAWGSDEVLAANRSVEEIYGRIRGLSPVCGFCDCPGVWCQGRDRMNVVDFTLVNVYGRQLVDELDAFIRSDFQLP